MYTQSHRISRVGRDPQGSSSPTPGSAQNNPKCDTTCLRTLSRCFLNSCEIWCCDHFHGEPIPVPNRALNEDGFANIHLKHYLTQLHAIENVLIILLSKGKTSFNISIIDNNQTEVCQFISSILRENLDLLEKPLTCITNSYYFLKV